jgi:radical SAM enzyme (TIGR01210 family)
VTYPAGTRERTLFILERRSVKPAHDPWRHQGILIEEERGADGRIANTATIFLTGRECPWLCVMCDLWRQTTARDTPAGSIPLQIKEARDSISAQHAAVDHIKLYNAANFFDPHAVPECDYDAIAVGVSDLACVTVESHPALIGPRLDRFRESLSRHAARAVPRLEVAMGLETAHPEALSRLNKQMTVGDFARAAEALGTRGVALRVFVLIAPPFVPASEQDEWLARSIDTAFDCGASAVSLIPTRPGNGAMDALAADGSFHPPTLGSIEHAAAAAFTRSARGRLFVDLWDVQRFAGCRDCFVDRHARLHAMNLAQRVLPRSACPRCGLSAVA